MIPQATLQQPARDKKIAALTAFAPRFTEQMRRRKYSLSASSIPGIFSWLDFFDFEPRDIRGSMCVLARHELGVFMYLPPLGRDVSSQTIEDGFAVMEELNGGKGVSRVENVGTEDLALFDDRRFDVMCKGYEYGYFRQDIEKFQGNPFKSQRSAYNQCVKTHQLQWMDFSEQMREECVRLYDQWADYKRSRTCDPIYRHMLAENRAVHDLIFCHGEAFGFIGKVVKRDGKICGYTFGFPLNNRVFCVTLEVTDPEIKGLPAFIFRKFCQDPQVKPYLFINAMDDFGMPNVARTKLAFRPAILWPSYVVSRKDRR